MAVTAPPEPIYADIERLPTILAQRRITNIRKKQLIKAASRNHNDPPPPPKLGECCGSSCDPCVTTLWKEELACWRERWGAGAIEQSASSDAAAKTEQAEPEPEPESIANPMTMPGSFDW